MQHLRYVLTDLLNACDEGSASLLAREGGSISTDGSRVQATPDFKMMNLLFPWPPSAREFAIMQPFNPYSLCGAENRWQYSIEF
jgi:hypothetical protein